MKLLNGLNNMRDFWKLQNVSGFYTIIKIKNVYNSGT